MIFLFLSSINLYSQERIQDYNWKDFYLQGEAHRRQGRSENALYYYRKAEKWSERYELTSEEHAMLLTAIGFSLANTTKEYDARDYFIKSLEYKSDQPDVHLFLARFEAKRRRYQNADEHYSIYRKLKPDDISVLREAALTLGLLGKSEEGRQLLSSVAKPADDVLRECQSYQKKQQYEKEVQCRERSMNLQPGNYDVIRQYWKSQIQLYQQTKNTDQLEKAEETSRYLRYLHSDNEDAVIIYAMTLFSEKKYSKARKELEEIEQKGTSNPLVFSLIAESLMLEDKSDEAEKYFLKADQGMGKEERSQEQR